MTLNSIIALILHFSSPISVSLLAKYVTVVEDRPIMSVNIVSQFQSSTFGHNGVVNVWNNLPASVFKISVFKITEQLRSL